MLVSVEVSVGEVKPDFDGIVKRSRGVANKMSKGVQFLMKANKIDVFMGAGAFTSKAELAVNDENGKAIESIQAKYFIIATGARPRELPSLKIDGEMIIDSEKAMTMPKQPKKMVIVGAGAIGVEFAYFYKIRWEQKWSWLNFKKHLFQLKIKTLVANLERSTRKKE